MSEELLEELDDLLENALCVDYEVSDQDRERYGGGFNAADRAREIMTELLLS